jgi:phytoene desaturase
MTPEGRRACVIGAGFGGLSLAIRLQAAGVATTLVEAHDQPGGCVHHWRSGGFTFEVGPATIGDPAGFAELWALTGHAIADDVELLPVAPIRRFNWPDGAVFDQSSDPRGLRAEIARLSGEDLGGYEQFLVHCAALGELEPDGQAFLGLRGMAEAAPAIARPQAWRPVHATI